MFEESSSILHREFEAGDKAGVQIHVRLAGEPIWDQAFASPTNPHLTTSTRMPWLSMTKPLVAYAIATLWDSGDLDLDRPVSDYLPLFGAHGKGQITTRHILTHTAGMRDSNSLPIQNYQKAVETAFSRAQEPGWIPGERAGYDVAGSWYVLAEIFRHMTGEAIDHFLHRTLFAELGMTHCFLSVAPHHLAAERSQFGRITGRVVPQLGTPSALDPTAADKIPFVPGAGGRGPMRELAHFFEFLRKMIQGTKSGFLRESTVRTMISPQRGPLLDETFQQTLDWGLGFMVSPTNPGLAPYGYSKEASSSAFGHGGSQIGMAFCDPQRELVVAWVCDWMPGEPKHQRRNRMLNAAIYRDLERLD